jgi:putative glutathione S-transferase
VSGVRPPSEPAAVELTGGSAPPARGRVSPDVASMAASSPGTGSFQRQPVALDERITADGSSRWPVEPGRCRLMVVRACPWANRAVIVRRLLGLEPVLSMGIAGPWPPTGFGQLMLDFSTQWTAHHRAGAPDLYPEPLRAEIDEICARNDAEVNNGVYRCGFASSQDAYEKAYRELFARLDELTDRLATRRCGRTPGTCSRPRASGTPSTSSRSSGTTTACTR